eukprot:Gb_25922 [translate_table: standard]
MCVGRQPDVQESVDGYAEVGPTQVVLLIICKSKFFKEIRFLTPEIVDLFFSPDPFVKADRVIWETPQQHLFLSGVRQCELSTHCPCGTLHIAYTLNGLPNT